jgi:hypothetical protein
MPRNEEKKVVQKLKSKKLKKVRYGFRTLLRLEYQKRYRGFHNMFVALSNDKSISYDECVKEQDFILRKQEKLRLAYGRYPLCCGVCGDRMKNLVFNPMMYQWRCVSCYEYAHEEFPEEYP